MLFYLLAPGGGVGDGGDVRRGPTETAEVHRRRSFDAPDSVLSISSCGLSWVSNSKTRYGMWHKFSLVKKYRVSLVWACHPPRQCSISTTTTVTINSIC